ncbi:MAG: hypothetical protein MRY74_08630 [Neomegalonema sp.]|nr:hypothetical protein [Neomegalonema sp.]
MAKAATDKRKTAASTIGVDQSLFQRDEAYAVSSWISQIEQIAMTATRRRTRTLGLVSPDQGAGVSKISELMATSFAKAQHSTLLLSLREPVDFSDAPQASWSPDATDASKYVMHDTRGFDVLSPAPTPATRALFNNVELMRRSIDGDLQRYSQIVMDLPNLNDTGADAINAIGPAVACDAVLLVCMTGRTTRNDARKAVERLQTAGANVAGTILNDEVNATLGGDIANFTRYFRWLSPSLARRIEQFCRQSSLLN